MDKKKVLEALNLDLEHEMSAMIRYLHHSFIVTGPLRGTLVNMFRTKARESMDHAITLGEKITALGGHPSVKIQAILFHSLNQGRNQFLPHRWWCRVRASV